MVKPLTVYKASAGSGKTFTLATEYIRLVVDNPQSYKTILAVTFTNKATEEMKMRILSQLYGIWKRLPDSADYMKVTCEKTGLPEQVVSERAGLALNNLLHNYNYFRVETIDTFFQGILRNLARELDLTANLRIGLNDVQVEELAVDRLIEDLSSTDLMLQWLLKYIMGNISDDKSWNVIGHIKQFGRTIFHNDYKQISKALNEKMAEPSFFEDYTTRLKEISKKAQERMKEIAEIFFDTLDSEGLTVDDFSYGKSGLCSFFLKMKDGLFDESIVGKRVADSLNDPEKWCKKTHPRRELILSLAETSLGDILRRAINERPQQYKLFKSADLTLQHLSQLRLLGSIEQKVRQLNDDANRFLLSDTQQLLHALIDGNDSPFIFEKTGTQLEHIMIDEFQDTSTVQWQNFKVLLSETMSHEDTSNLIVGDVKQSIYRWRSGDWRLLNAIDQEFPHADEMVEIRPLETNYRSERNIVDFNNAFFTLAAEQEFMRLKEENSEGASQLQHAYADVCQQVPAQREPRGLVNIRLLPSDDYQDQTMSLLIDTVQKLRQQGVSISDMAILVRTNKHIPLIADYFAVHLPDVRIVSDEAFRLDASVSVCLLVQALHLLTHPDDLLAKATIAKLYHLSILRENIAEEELLIKDRQLDDLLPEAYIRHFEELKQLPLFELVERLYAIFSLQHLNEQSAYICAFYDQLNQFTQDNSTDIDAFVREWEETISNKTIQSDANSGIRILSIHKSKGLEFNHVIIPFCDWKLEMADILWCEPTIAPFDALPIAPIDYSQKQMRGTIYERAFMDEHLQNTVDNLNLLYVAFTRAVCSLFVIGQRGSKSNRSALLENVLGNIELNGATLHGQADEQEVLEFTFGTMVTSEQSSHVTQSENIFLQPVTTEPVQLESFEVKTEFRQSNRSRDFMNGDDEQQELSYIKLGSVLHEIFSTIRTTADIPQALLQMQQEGILYDNEVTREKLMDIIRKRLTDTRVKEWFSERWQLFNECSILRLDEHGEVVERRPDRVITDGKETHVIDFKFGRQHEEYHAQVGEYIQLLRQMQMPHVRGWLWYVYSNKIEEVRCEM